MPPRMGGPDSQSLDLGGLPLDSVLTRRWNCAYEGAFYPRVYRSNPPCAVRPRFRKGLNQENVAFGDSGPRANYQTKCRTRPVMGGCDAGGRK